MSDQPSLFHEDIYDALRELIVTIGGGQGAMKRVGALLRPDLPADAAGSWLKDCLNRERREKLDPEQLAFLLRKGREAGVHCAMNFLAGNTGYDAKPVDPEDERAKLQREFNEHVEMLGRVLERIERTATLPSKIKAVS